MKQICHPERKRSCAKRMIFGVEGPCVLHAAAHTRSLHAPIDRYNRSIDLVGMTIELRLITGN